MLAIYTIGIYTIEVDIYLHVYINSSLLYFSTRYINTAIDIAPPI